MSIKFIKMHGLGNDFIFIDKKDLDQEVDYNFITKICDRNLGIGCEQLILYDRLEKQRYLMQVFNHDGSSAGMCGNATRCLGLHVYQEFGEREITILLNEREVSVIVESDDLIRVNMGVPIFEKTWMPKISEFADMIADYRLSTKEMMCVDMGNKHLIIFYDSLSQKEKELLGENFQKHLVFEEGVNINFAKINQDAIDLQVYESGVGFTFACGSGACATFAAATKLKFIDNNVIIRFKIGDLHMSYSGEDIIMSGPACKVAQGVYYG